MSASATEQPVPLQDGSDLESQASHTQTPAHPPQHHAIPSQRTIPNRVAYLGLISVFAPTINFALNWKQTAEMDLGTAIFTWVAFGLFGSVIAAPLAILLIRLIVSALLRLLDHIPALGISTWVCASTWLTVFLFRGHSLLPVFSLNLPLFILAWINLSLSKGDFIRDHALRSFFNLPGDTTIGTSGPCSPHFILPRVFYMFENGQCCCQREQNRFRPAKTHFTLNCLSVPEHASASLQNIIQRGFYYVMGYEAGTYPERFNAWQIHAQQVVANINRRRLLFLVGFLCEAVAVVCIVSLLGNMVGVSSVRYYERPYFTSPLQFRWYQVTAALLLISFSDYLHLLVNTRDSFTSLTEVRALMLHCVSSRIFNWAKPRTSYLTNGRWLPGPKTLFAENAIPVGELPLLGYVGDQNERDIANETVLKSTVWSTLVSLERGDDNLLSLGVFRRENGAGQSSENGIPRPTLLPHDMVR